MRVTTRSMSRNYLKTLNNNLGKRSESMRRMTTKMKYENLSENVADGYRAIRADQRIFKIESQLSGIENAMGELETADQVLQDVLEVMTDLAQGDIERAANIGEPEKRQTVANNIKIIKDQILQFANGKYGDKYLFSGTNNGSAPFTVDKDGQICYNSIPVKDIQKDADGYFRKDVNTGERIPIPWDKDVYLDIGQGVKVEESHIDTATAFKISFSGLEILGMGETDGMPNNIYDLLSDIEDALRAEPYGAEEQKEVMRLHDQFMERHSALLMSETDLGSRVNFLERTTDRLKSEVDTLESVKKNLVATDMEEESVALQEHEAVWKATLALGANLFQQSLIDFLR